MTPNGQNPRRVPGVLVLRESAGICACPTILSLLGELVELGELVAQP